MLEAVGRDVVRMVSLGPTKRAPAKQWRACPPVAPHLLSPPPLCLHPSIRGRPSVLE